MESIRRLREAGALRPMDLHFAEFARRVSGSSDERLLLAAALVSRVTADGNICLRLDLVAGSEFPAELPDEVEDETGERVAGQARALVRLPPLEEWLAALRAPAARTVVGGPDDRSLLVLDGDCRLYLRRFWQFENNVARRLLALACPPAGELACPAPDAVFPTDFGARLRALLPDAVGQDGDRHRLAAFLGLRNRLTIITGGPGTGKTYAVARILALMFGAARADAGRAMPRVLLAAPTGKAAMRVSESIRDAKANLDPAIQGLIPDEAATLHRLLGVNPDVAGFRHGADNPLDADLLIIDEASMIDIHLMAATLDALGPDTRLILLGDRHQLASVEAGCVLRDICRAAESDEFSDNIRQEYEARAGLRLEDPGLRWTGPGGLGDCVVRFGYSRRFPPESPIGKLSRAVNIAAGPAAASAAWDIVAGWTDSADVARHDTPASLYDGRRRPLRAIREIILDGYRDYLNAESPAEAFRAIRSFSILCALRRGPFGVARLNRLVEEVLSFARAATSPAEPGARRSLAPAPGFYDRRLIMIARNDYSLRLFNGDLGVVFREQDPRDPERTLFVVYFERLDEAGNRDYRPIPAAMLPAHETAFAMTIHKSQGSEFDKVLVMLPPVENPVITRELIYTAITRTRRKLELWCSADAFRSAVRRETLRASGLRDRLAVGPPLSCVSSGDLVEIRPCNAHARQSCWQPDTARACGRCRGTCRNL
ncbi:MAG: exodeoxyribonuclease V subunit alpha [Verrucomicrobiota bacterium]|nr:exodeoxyribonuclease V subunit alpha [Verrucomicrobiota bacterium]